MRGVTRAWPRVCRGRTGFLAKRSLRSFKSRQSWGWALVVVVINKVSAKRMVIARENSAAGFGVGLRGGWRTAERPIAHRQPKVSCATSESVKKFAACPAAALAFDESSAQLASSKTLASKEQIPAVAF